MVDEPEGTHCVSGDMWLSQMMERGLREVFVEESRPAMVKPRREGFRWGGRWFCPRCGVEMQEGQDSVTCPRCGKQLDEFIYELMELHPHLRPDGRYG